MYNHDFLRLRRVLQVGYDNKNKNLSRDEIANVTFYNDIARVLQNTKTENLLRPLRPQKVCSILVKFGI